MGGEDATRWWQPGDFWPVPNWPEDDYGIGALEQVFLAIGFVDCELDAAWEPQFLKIALYGAGFEYTHAARQLPNEKWTSKLGKGEDIEHDSPHDVGGGLYGEVTEIMKKPIPLE